jgi:hypothetical protein
MPTAEECWNDLSQIKDFIYTVLKRPAARDWSIVCAILSCSCRPKLIKLDRSKSVIDGLDARVHILMPVMPTPYAA